jgi:DNA topoisomerase I
MWSKQCLLDSNRESLKRKRKNVSKALIIVESPAKARTISRFLKGDYVVESSIGHVRDLPSRAADIPPSYKKKPWARTGVDIENGFKPLYIVPGTKKPQVKKLKDLMNDADELYLATDEDREGEAIAWHLTEVLKPTIPVKRMVFHEITAQAITAALESPRDLDDRLVDAQEARRILDRLYGYEVSPVLWKKVRPRLSAGRVQSVATRVVVDREQARRDFRSADYWGVTAVLGGGAKNVEDVTTTLMEISGQRVAIGRDFSPDTGALTENARAAKVVVLSEDAANALQAKLKGATFQVNEVIRKPFTQRPAAPFITSTLQQDAGRKLRFTAKRTMRTAQRLYENGYITYMRTDSTHLSDEAVKASRTQIEELFGKENLPDAPRTYTKKVKGAQEAHEAIRPAGEKFKTPDSVRAELDEDAIRLYELIWKRTLASQMRDAKGERTTIRFGSDVDAALAKTIGVEESGQASFQVSGKVVLFPGFLNVYVESSEDGEKKTDDLDRLLPPMEEGQKLDSKELEAKCHTTLPPARFTEASLVKELEQRGIGRPSTYASIIQTIQDRGYVWKKSGALVPTLTAFAVTRLLVQHFGDLVDYEFTARMESDLDEISRGTKEAVPWLSVFYFGSEERQAQTQEDGRSVVATLGLQKLIGTGVEDIDAREVCSIYLGENEDGERIAARVGRYGPYLQIGDTDTRANIPDDIPLDELDKEHALRLLAQAQLANRVLGEHPENKKPVYLRSGRYGPYVQLGDPELTPKGNVKKGSKPRMASLFPTMTVETLTLEEAVFLLSFPKVLGTHPEHGSEITVQDGQYGPYISMEVGEKRDSRSLENHEQMQSINLDQALELFLQPRSRRKAQGPLALLANSPVTGTPIEVRTGRFGPYVTDGQINATIPSTRDPLKVTFDEALEFISAREDKIRQQGEDPRAPKTKRAPAKKAAKKATKKKATKKKATKKKATKKKATKKKAATSEPDEPAAEAPAKKAKPKVMLRSGASKSA